MNGSFAFPTVTSTTRSDAICIARAFVGRIVGVGRALDEVLKFRASAFWVLGKRSRPNNPSANVVTPFVYSTFSPSPLVLHCLYKYASARDPATRGIRHYQEPPLRQPRQADHPACRQLSLKLVEDRSLASAP